ncbi:hypothetical protein [Planktotalea sp.]|uniref:hypothetical protein n=1 Tax=Planktotalea sp. TaxID=2029877 RepID=UPI00345A3C57
MAHVVELGCAISEVAERLGISTKSLHTWKVRFAKSTRVWLPHNLRIAPSSLPHRGLNTKGRQLRSKINAYSLAQLFCISAKAYRVLGLSAL